MDEIIFFKNIIETGVFFMVAGIVIKIIPDKHQNDDEKSRNNAGCNDIITFGTLYIIIGFIGKKFYDSLALDMMIALAIVTIIGLIKFIADLNLNK